MDVDPQPSATLLAANERLAQLRATLAAERLDEAPNGRFAPRTPLPATPDWSRLVAELPPHLGWENGQVIAGLRGSVAQSPPDPTATLLVCARGEGKGKTAVAPQARQDSVKLYPDLALGMLRTGETAVGRLWLLLRHLDQPGCGKVRVDLVIQQLTTKTSPLHLCGKRQLRNLLRAGDGIYWTRDRQYVWLRSTAKVAHALGVEQLTGWPVALPLAVLLGGIGDFRAHLYAAFHSGRAKETDAPNATRPIARATLVNLTGVGRSSQRTYEMRLNLRVQANFAVGETVNRLKQEERAWQHGRAAFQLIDSLGKQGRPGQTYLAWQLPNSYAGQHRRLPKGRQKRINRQLKDLVMQGIPGNDGHAVVKQSPEQRYCANGKLAAQQANRRANQDFYWHATPTPGRSCQIWRLFRSGD